MSDEVQNLNVIFIDDLQPSTAYEVRVRARTNSANSVVAVEYAVVTLDLSGQVPTPERVNRAGNNRRQHHLTPSGGVINTYQLDAATRGFHGHHSSGSHVVLPWWLIGSVSAVGTASMLGLVVACFCLYKSISLIKQHHPRERGN